MRLIPVVLAMLLCAVAAGIAAAYAFKLRGIRRREEMEAYAAKHRVWFAYALDHLEGEEALVPPPAPLKKEEIRFVQERLIGWIERFRGGQQVKLIALCEEMGLVERQLRRLNSPLEWARLDAAYYLGCMRSRRAVPGLLKLLAAMRSGPMMFIVGRAVAKCARHPDELRDLVHLLLARKKEAHSLVADILAETELELSAMLTTFLRGGDAECVRLALAAMKKRPLAGCGGELLRLTGAAEADIRVGAARLLLRDAGCAAEVPVRQLLAHRDGEVRALAAQAAGRLGLRECLAPLRSALADADWQVRLNAARALAALGAEGFAALREAAGRGRGAAAGTGMGAGLELGAQEARDAIREELRRREAASRGTGWIAIVAAE